jgi:hypothetical protein
MRSSTFILLSTLSCLLPFHSCFAGLVSEPIAFGAWSEATNELRGRLLFAEGTPDKYGVRYGLVYLELQNLALGDNVYVYYDAKRSPLKCELHDSAGATVKNSLGSGADWRPSACWLALPNDSTLRFRTGFSGSGPDHPCLFIMSSFEGGKWEIPVTATNDYFLSGTFSTTSPTNEIQPSRWEGTLKLPPVRIPVKSP